MFSLFIILIGVGVGYSTNYEFSSKKISVTDKMLKDYVRQVRDSNFFYSRQSEKNQNIILNNPYEEINWDKINFYKANFHTHTTECHGEISFRSTISKYHKAGYDILSITSHDTLQTEDTAWPWKDFDKDPEELGMLAVEGNEISNPHHIGSYFNSYGDKDVKNAVQALKEISDRDGKAMMFHPGEYDKEVDWYVDLYEKFYQDPLMGMEVYNQIDKYPEDRKLWDELNAKLMPEKVVFGYSNDDMHKKYQLFNNYQYMLMEELNNKELKKAMKRGSLFFVYEKWGKGRERIPQIERVKAKDGKVIKIKARNYDKIKWIGEGTKKIQKGNTLDITNCDSIFVRAVIKNSWGNVYTQPFTLKKE